MGKKPDLEIKLFYKEDTLMSGESQGPYTYGATDPDFKHSEVYADNILINECGDVMNHLEIKDASRLPFRYKQKLIKIVVREINNFALHELSHKYSKCGHYKQLAQNTYKNSYIHSYTERNFDDAIKKILDWCMH
jgi:hypothetical protein